MSWVVDRQGTDSLEQGRTAKTSESIENTKRGFSKNSSFDKNELTSQIISEPSSTVIRKNQFNRCNTKPEKKKRDSTLAKDRESALQASLFGSSPTVCF